MGKNPAAAGRVPPTPRPPGSPLASDTDLKTILEVIDPVSSPDVSIGHSPFPRQYPPATLGTEAAGSENFSGDDRCSGINGTARSKPALHSLRFMERRRALCVTAFRWGYSFFSSWLLEPSQPRNCSLTHTRARSTERLRSRLAPRARSLKAQALRHGERTTPNCMLRRNPAPLLRPHHRLRPLGATRRARFRCMRPLK